MTTMKQLDKSPKHEAPSCALSPEIMDANRAPGMLETLGEMLFGEQPVPDHEILKEAHRHRFESPLEIALVVNPSKTIESFAEIEGELPEHERPLEMVLAEVDSDGASGLTSAEAAQRLLDDGPNELEKPPRVSLLMLFILQLTQIIIVLLLSACAASAAINAAAKRTSVLDYIDSIAILMIVLLNAIIAAVTEVRGLRVYVPDNSAHLVALPPRSQNAANGALEALDSLSAAESACIRDGKEMMVPSAQLVKGDIILIKTGDVIPADARLIESADLKVNEMLLTGESEDVSKSEKVKKPKKGEGEKLTADNMIFSSCTCKAGNSKAVIVRTGMRTRVGEIAKLLTGEDGAGKKGCLPDTSANQTPLQVALQKLAVKIGFLAIGCCLFVFVCGLALGTTNPDDPETAGWLYMILISVTLTVAAIPEGLPLCVTISLSTGCSDMVKQHVRVFRDGGRQGVPCCILVCRAS